ncbi:DUF2274 domain-containing protein [Komagataeibacter intermedius]|uniref:DUF2274 domain-containing protein n=2 Tax=Komagataeibacter intermedius TaxID=66229 RepID=A0A0N0MEC1_9PROT|nr:DUF2274 domain-containing protein [Komagataeibacter intermedius]KPH86243.1 hypothetical protein GLUCOINTEAF2_0202858 [Komagataeibacter intermedius AF2]MCF3637251.1 DUF2274 domain-containing protein [Komagataeibacter intermedius]GAN87830.1 hypothetical protein Gain_0098_002 [Komagataeibacter intermedius TF2]GBQ72922.1 hypothetical protein AA0521_2231 [Komagataeibacter intermedius NRIC 0521]
MTKLRISTIPDSRPVKLTIELPAEIHRDLLLYAELVSGKAGEAADATPDAARLVPLMVGRFMETDRAFQKQRRSRKPASAVELAAIPRGR